MTDCLDDETGSRVTYDYFSRDPWVDDSPGTYADFGAATVHNRSVEWQHPVGEVVSALAAAGLRIEFLHEHDATLFARYPALVRQGRLLPFSGRPPAHPDDVLGQGITAGQRLTRVRVRPFVSGGGHTRCHD